jgi:hypothetical protein
MQRLAVLSIPLALVLYSPFVAAQSGGASFTGARRAGGSTAPYAGGDLAYEVEITNTRSNALRTNLIIEAPTTPSTPNKLYRTIAINVPGNSKAFIPFTHTGGFNAAFCSHMSFYVKLENGGAPAATVQIKPGCTFKVVGLKTVADSAIGNIGVIWAHSQVLKPVTCASGVSLTSTIKNQTLKIKNFTVSIDNGSERALSPTTLLSPGQSKTVTVTLGAWPKFSGSVLPGWFSKLAAGGDEKQPNFGFSLERACQPTVSLAQGTIAYF